MKHCPTCKRVESDDALAYCRVDGTTLVSDSLSSGDNAGTAMFVPGAVSSEIETNILPNTKDTSIDRNTAATTALPAQPNQSSTRKLSKPKQRRFGVALIALTLVVMGVAGYLYSRKPENVAIGSIAVLPFVNQNNDPNVDYLADGIPESIINSLSQLPNLKVMSRNSVFHYKGKEMDAQAVAKDLKVQAVLTGRVAQRGDGLSIYVELINAQDNSQIWGQQYDRKSSDLVSLQNEIARDVSSKLKTKLSGMDEQKLAKTYTANSEAYQLYLRGRFYWNKRTVEDFKRAVPYFQQAIDKDPNYALAYSGLADCYALLGVFGAGPPMVWMPQAKTTAMKALALDDNLGEAHASLGQITWYYDWDFTGAERELRRAIELNPSYATAHQWYAEILSSEGRHDEAIAEIRRALELDPLSLIINRVYGDLLLNARRYDEAISQCGKTLEMDPNFPTTHGCLGRAYGEKRMYDQAFAEFMEYSHVSLSPEELASIKEAYDRSGWNAFLQARLTFLLGRSKKRYVTAFAVAALYARLNQKDEAFAWLENAYQERDYQMTGLKVMFEFDSLRADPRFADLLRRVGLPQ